MQYRARYRKNIAMRAARSLFSKSLEQSFCLLVDLLVAAFPE
jgi:hypothetical protein